jgi:hypothetical protein
MEQVRFAFNLYRIQFRMMFGPKHRFRKEYDNALDILEERGHWLYLYDRLDGPKGEEVCEALKAWLDAFQEKKKGDVQAFSDEKRLKRQLHLLIYGEFIEGVHGYVDE